MNENETELLAAVTELVTALRADMSKHAETMTAKYDAIAGEFGKMKADADKAGERRRKPDEDEERGTDDMGDGHNDMARRVAADQVVVRSAVASLASSVNELKKSQRPMADLNAYADAQEKATKVMVSLGGAAEPPMAGEDIVAYNIRLARKMQPHSPRWKGVDLNIIAADRQALDGILDQIRADATAAGLSPVGLKLGQFREVVTQSPGGHKVTNFVGSTETTGTIFKQLSRPVRHVAFIGTRTPAPHY